MGYAVGMEIYVGGEEPAEVAESVSMTSNVACMWRHAMPDTNGVAGLDGMKGCDALPHLLNGIARMKSKPDAYLPMEPPNGWGSYAGAVRFLCSLRDMATKAPLATFRVWR